MNLISHEEIYSYIKTDITKKKRFQNRDTLDINEIKIIIKNNIVELKLNEIEEKQLFNEMLNRYTRENTIGTVEQCDLLKKEYATDWLKNNEPTPYLDRYAQFLRNKGTMSDETIDKIKKDAKDILNACANPKAESNEKRKGLVVGEVQSGKTSNYIALANVAVDYGYKLIIVLTGITESLRKQTQERFDEGFVGVDSTTAHTRQMNYLGVGSLAGVNQRYAICYTDKLTDFTDERARSTHSGIELDMPIILVVKKQLKILTSIRRWIKAKNVLIIDDEADNASINTNSEESPTKINAAIRKILEKVDKSTYVGYTATPYANVFIDASVDDDLFPEDFIVNLKSPEEYFGSQRVFLDKNSRVIKEISTKEKNHLCASHKKDVDYQVLSESLEEAILSFVINSAIYTEKGSNVNKHRTMMVNISRFISLHKRISNRIDEYIENLRVVLKEALGHKITEKNVYLYDEIKKMYQMFNTDSFYVKFKEEYNFFDLLNTISQEASKIIVSVINSGNKFYYDEYRDRGARVIIIGGFVLSRGLTLEGLMVSYYNRTTNMYDSLLQMCRWFGYRKGYDDLCRIYMTAESKSAFLDAVNADVDLRKQFETLASENKTPKDYILLVQEEPNLFEMKLTVTAKNKMKSTALTYDISLGGKTIETTKVSLENNSKNISRFHNFIEELKTESLYMRNDDDSTNHLLIKDIPKELIVKFIKDIHVEKENRTYDKDAISEFILEKENADKLNLWDMVIPEGSVEEKWELGKYELKPVKRKYAKRENEEFVRIGGDNNRIVSPNYFAAGLSKTQLEEVKRKLKDSNNGTSDRVYLSVKNRKPLLIVMPIMLNHGNHEEKIELEEPLLAFALGFPTMSSQNKKAIYRYNNTIKISESDYENDE